MVVPSVHRNNTVVHVASQRVERDGVHKRGVHPDFVRARGELVRGIIRPQDAVAQEVRLRPQRPAQTHNAVGVDGAAQVLRLCRRQGVLDLHVQGHVLAGVVRRVERNDDVERSLRRGVRIQKRARAGRQQLFVQEAIVLVRSVGTHHHEPLEVWRRGDVPLQAHHRQPVHPGFAKHRNWRRCAVCRTGDDLRRRALIPERVNASDLVRVALVASSGVAEGGLYFGHAALARGDDGHGVELLPVLARPAPVDVEARVVLHGVLPQERYLAVGFDRAQVLRCWTRRKWHNVHNDVRGV